MEKSRKKLNVNMDLLLIHQVYIDTKKVKKKIKVNLIFFFNIYII